MSLTQQRLKELFDYDPETGIVTRRITVGSRAKKGAVVGSDDGNGYLQVWIDGKKYRLHRVIWFWVYGAWPEDEVDHRDLKRANNRLKNLVPLTHMQNMHNGPKRCTNTSGYVGVSRTPNGNSWIARITVGYKNLNLGTFENIDQAAAAYSAARCIYHPTAPQGQQ